MTEYAYSRYDPCISFSSAMSSMRSFTGATWSCLRAMRPFLIHVTNVGQKAPVRD